MQPNSIRRRTRKKERESKRGRKSEVRDMRNKKEEKKFWARERESEIRGNKAVSRILENK